MTNIALISADNRLSFYVEVWGVLQNNTTHRVAVLLNTSTQFSTLYWRTFTTLYLRPTAALPPDPFRIIFGDISFSITLSLRSTELLAQGKWLRWNVGADTISFVDQPPFFEERKDHD